MLCFCLVLITAAFYLWSINVYLTLLRLLFLFKWMFHVVLIVVAAHIVFSCGDKDVYPMLLEASSDFILVGVVGRWDGGVLC